MTGHNSPASIIAYPLTAEANQCAAARLLQGKAEPKNMD